ncbi:cyclic nucleotide-binding domain-containing protein [Devosia sp.]|uniref:cyclic nucleotide-binding domain-containing protein n=1 Tax=Devosia sp. TaxID=1871048 RepID=UPI002611EA9A|nr:cyclic nucleotide-binding domain-containing protein [Devosia sp.]
MLEPLLRGLTDPVILFGHFTYFLLIVSMVMRRMVALRLLAVGSGLAKIVYRAFFVFDPVSVLWETVFVAVNVVQLVLIWYYERHHRFDEDHRHFAENMPENVDRSAIKRMLDLSDLERYEPGAILTAEGAKVERLVYLADGIVKIERGDRVVAICGPGDYIGELSFLSGNPASATATVVKPTRALIFDQARLSAAMASDTQLQRTLESALNRNLAGKLTRANQQPRPSI